MRRTSSRLAAKRATESIAKQSGRRGEMIEEKKAAAKRKRSSQAEVDKEAGGKRDTGSTRQKKGKVDAEGQQQQEAEVVNQTNQEMQDATSSTDATQQQEQRPSGQAESSTKDKGKEEEGDKEEEEGVEEFPEQERHEMGLGKKDLIPPESRGTDFLEKGLIYFFYRPRVCETEVKSLVDVNRMYVLLSPKQTIHPSDAAKVHRLLLIGRKKLPEPSPRHRFWALVEKTSENIADIHDFLGKETYDTQTRGERTIEAERPVGEGFYGILTHHGHTHLCYVLEQPQDPGDAQKTFNIVKEGSYIINVKNPKNVDQRYPQSEKDVEMPSELIDIFRDRRWAPTNPPALLNYEGVQVVMIGASDDLVDEFGAKGRELEKDEAADVKQAPLEPRRLFQELKITPAERKEIPTEPLMEGVLK